MYTPVDHPVSSAMHTQRLKPVDGSLYVTQFFEGEQEHILSISEISGDNKRNIGDFCLYSLEENLFARRPYKGDLHIHSHHSDGKESPAYVVAACRRIGLDFVAITDHYVYAPSIEAQEAFESVDIDMKIFRGEEIHPPKNPVHMVNFGGSASVNELFKGEEYHREVKEISEGLTNIPQDDIRYQYASCLWCFDKVREYGGLGIFCHPYWRYARRQCVISDRIIDLLFEGQ